MKRYVKLKLLLCLLVFAVSTSSGAVLAADGEEDVIPPEYSEIPEEEDEADEIQIAPEQAEKLLKYLGAVEDFVIYKVPEEIEGNVTDEERELIGQLGDFVAVEVKEKKTVGIFYESSQSDDGVVYISESGNFLLTVDNDLTRPLKIRKAVSPRDDKLLFYSSDGKSLELMSEDYSSVEEKFHYIGKDKDKIIYQNSQGSCFAWLGSDGSSVLGTFIYAAENEKFRLIADKRTGIMGIENKNTGYIWWSSPLDALRDNSATPLIQNELRSSAVVRYGVPEKRNGSNWIRSGAGECDFTVTEIPGGIRVYYDFKSAGISFPAEFTLEEDYLKASLKVSDITETNKSNIVTEITLLGSFGAGTSEEDGYFIIPDGSGAVIDFNNGSTQKSAYSGKVYGADLTAVPNRKDSVIQQICLPVYGIVKENNGLLAVASKGDSNAILKAATSGLSNSSYNICNFTFVLRNTDSFYMSGNITEEVTVFQGGAIDSDDIEVRYYPISSENLSYTDIAGKYREYLLEENGVKAVAEESSWSMHLGLYGGTEKKTPILGIPITMNKEVTGYSQAEEILSGLKNKGVGDMVVSYNNWTEDGIENKIDTEAEPSDTLGGSSDFRSLMDFAGRENILIYPVTDNRDFYSGNGYYAFTDTAIRVSGAYSRIVSYDRAYGVADGSKANKSLLSPICFKEIFNEVADNYSLAGFTGVSPGELTTSLYGDYGRNKISRYDAMNILTESWEELDFRLEKGILAKGANAYSLPYVKYISNIPNCSSRFDIFDRDIPFYQLVLHGVIPYSTTAINGSPDPEELFLQAISTGSQLNFDFIYEDAGELKDTEYDIYFYANYKYWLETAAQAYKLSQEILSGVKDCTIERYSQSDDGKITETVYSDGTVIKVDFDNRTIDCGNKRYDLEDHKGKGGIVF